MVKELSEIKDNEKYKNWLHFFLAYLYRCFNRRRISALFCWNDSTSLDEGCTAIIGMCSRLPYVLAANLRCLQSTLWPDLKQIIITVDALKDSLPSGFERELLKQFPKLNIHFEYYNEKQFRFAEKVKLPYLFSWLSWLIALNRCQTKTALIHDYDALVFGKFLEQRYQRYLHSKVAIQGISWYWANGIVPEDRLACTFEAFVDVEWIRSFSPITLFNKVALWKGRRMDFDTLLEIQANYTPEENRSIIEVEEENFVHPTQMIHQYTMARKFRGKPQACSALTMIPLFYYLSGKKNFFKQVGENIKKALPAKKVDFLADGCTIDFSYLTSEEIDKMLQRMVKVCIKLDLKPFGELIEYGNALYSLAGVPFDQAWKGNFSPEQKKWIVAAR